MNTFLYDDQSYSVQLQRQADGSYLATIGEQVISVNITPLADSSLLIESAEGHFIVHTASEGDTRHAAVMGQSFTFNTGAARSIRRRSSGARNDLTAQMPGQVVDVLVKAGESVVSGQTLVILEAMKMESRVQAPADATVKQVLVKTGDTVERGQQLVELIFPE